MGVRLWVWGLEEDAGSSWGKEWVGHFSEMVPGFCEEDLSFQELFCPEAALSSCGPLPHLASTQRWVRP